MNYRTLIKLACSLLIFTASCKGEVAEEEVEPRPDIKNELVYIFKRGEAGYDLFRIPAIVKSANGTLLAFSEARKESSNGDSGDIDLVVKRSNDEGETWGDMIMVWNDAGNTCGNPVPIVDVQQGVIHLLMTWNNGGDNWSAIHNGTAIDTRRVFATKSDDDGLSWEIAKEITGQVKLPEWKWYGTGPVHGIQISAGPFQNRLVAPCYYTVMVDGVRQDYSHVIYSDDAGATWSAGGSTPQGNVGECTVAEVSGGKLLLNMRSSDSFLRKVSTSVDGGSTWSAVTTDPVLIDPKCQGSIVSVNDNGTTTVLFVNAASSTRENMTIKLSEDEGGSWSKKAAVYEGPSAYSDVVMLSNDTVAIVFEMGGNSPYGNIVFKRVALNELK